MNDDIYSGDLHAWIEPEIEARVVALILGEASEFEAEELERLMEERPEIRIFKRRLESVHGLLGVALAPDHDDEWKLAPERRASLFRSMELVPAEDEAVVLESAVSGGAKERRIRKAGHRVIWSAAACFAVTLFLFAIIFRIASKGPLESLKLTDDSESMRAFPPGSETREYGGAPAAGKMADFDLEPRLASRPDSFAATAAATEGEELAAAVTESKKSLRGKLAQLGKEALYFKIRGGITPPGEPNGAVAKNNRLNVREAGVAAPLARGPGAVQNALQGARTGKETGKGKSVRDEAKRSTDGEDHDADPFGDEGSGLGLGGGGGGLGGFGEEAPLAGDLPVLGPLSGPAKTPAPSGAVPRRPAAVPAPPDPATPAGERIDSLSNGSVATKRPVDEEDRAERPTDLSKVGRGVLSSLDAAPRRGERSHGVQSESLAENDDFAPRDEDRGRPAPGTARPLTPPPAEGQTQELGQGQGQGQAQADGRGVAISPGHRLELKGELADKRDLELAEPGFATGIARTKGGAKTVPGGSRVDTVEEIQNHLANEPESGLALGEGGRGRKHDRNANEAIGGFAGQLRGDKIPEERRDQAAKPETNIPQAEPTPEPDANGEKKPAGQLGRSFGKKAKEGSTAPDRGASHKGPKRFDPSPDGGVLEVEGADENPPHEFFKAPNLSLAEIDGDGLLGAPETRPLEAGEVAKDGRTSVAPGEPDNQGTPSLPAPTTRRGANPPSPVEVQTKAIEEPEAEIEDPAQGENEEALVEALPAPKGSPDEHSLHWRGKSGGDHADQPNLLGRSADPKKKSEIGSVEGSYEYKARGDGEGRERKLLKDLTSTLQSSEDAAEIGNEENLRDGKVGAGAIEVRTWEIPVAAWKRIRSGQATSPAKLNARELLSRKDDDQPVTGAGDALKNYGVAFPEGATVNYLASSGKMVVKNTAENLALIDTLVQKSLEQTAREREALKHFEKSASEEPYSTFSLHVSDVSFKLAKAALDRGEWPAADQIRVEEFVNAFDYGDPAPTQDDKVACQIEQAAHPFLQQRNLLRISMRTAALGRGAGIPLRLTVLLDNSGSMDRADRVESVKKAFQHLAAQLNPQDQVTLVSFARSARLLADRLAGDHVAQLANLVDATPSEGGTNIEEALHLGITKAKEQFLEGGQNRIILLTDGAANLGNAKPDDLAKLVEGMRQQGIAFDACGVGAEGLNDEILETLTRKGDGRYYLLDRPEDADAGFAKQIAGALRPAARNVKIQVNFNPDRVGRYRLHGFEKHILKKEDFRNDSVDAAELASEEAGNAVYQVEVRPEGEGEIGTVSVRFQDMASGQMVEKMWTIPYEANAPRLDDAAPSLRLASGAALLGEKLKGSMVGEAVEMDRLGKIINTLPGGFPSDARVKHLAEMAAKARELAPE